MARTPSNSSKGHYSSISGPRGRISCWRSQPQAKSVDPQVLKSLLGPSMDPSTTLKWMLCRSCLEVFLETVDGRCGPGPPLKSKSYCATWWFCKMGVPQRTIILILGTPKEELLPYTLNPHIFPGPVRFCTSAVASRTTMAGRRL